MGIRMNRVVIDANDLDLLAGFWSGLRAGIGTGERRLRR
jgi:hypothetical protein